MRQDLGMDETTDCEESGQEAYDLIEELKEIIYGEVEKNKDI
jgi:hypothetical protein